MARGGGGEAGQVNGDCGVVMWFGDARTERRGEERPGNLFFLSLHFLTPFHSAGTPPRQQMSRLVRRDLSIGRGRIRGTDMGIGTVWVWTLGAATALNVADLRRAHPSVQRGAIPIGMLAQVSPMHILLFPGCLSRGERERRGKRGAGEREVTRPTS